MYHRKFDMVTIVEHFKPAGGRDLHSERLRFIEFLQSVYVIGR